VRLPNSVQRRRTATLPQARPPETTQNGKQSERVSFLDWGRSFTVAAPAAGSTVGYKTVRAG
jgi:hypothetical protein